MGEVFSVRVTAITPVGTFESVVETVTADELTELQKGIEGIAGGGSYFEMDTTEGSIVLATGTIANSVFRIKSWPTI
jgi:hypothetical protein